MKTHLGHWNEIVVQNSCFCSPTSAGDGTNHLRKWYHLLLSSTRQAYQISIRAQQPRHTIDKARSISCWEIGKMGSKNMMFFQYDGIRKKSSNSFDHKANYELCFGWLLEVVPQTIQCWNQTARSIRVAHCSRFCSKPKTACSHLWRWPSRNVESEHCNAT